jgi:hypothetical protein
MPYIHSHVGRLVRRHVRRSFSVGGSLAVPCEALREAWGEVGSFTQRPMK